MAKKKHGFSVKALFHNKKVTIPVVCGVVALAILITVWSVLSAGWKTGDRVMPAFLADMGLYQGKSFTYFDGITINGLDVSGMTLKQAKAAVGKAESDNGLPYSITVSAGGRSCVFTEADFSYAPSNDDSLLEAKAYCVTVMRGQTAKAPKAFYTEVSFSDEARQHIAEKGTAELNCEPTDATFDGISGGQANFTDEVPGVVVDTEDLIHQLQTFMSSGQTTGEVTVSYSPKVPSVTKAALEKHVTKLATATSKSTNTADATANMRKAIELCDGSVIAPGETWSFNQHTGNSNIEADGWRKAVEYRGGKQAWGIGGGICQASTCIYNAALRSNMEVVERHYHYWASGYAKAGFDATIDYPSLDLRLKNNTAYPMYFECYMNGVNMTVNVYGYQSDEYDEITLTGKEIKRVAGDYYTVNATRTLWKDGKVVRTDNLGNSQYSLKTKTWEGESSSTPSSSTPSSSTPSSSTPSSSTPSSSQETSSQEPPASSSTTPSSSQDSSSETGPSQPVTLD